jgi:hypothetical protein
LSSAADAKFFTELSIEVDSKYESLFENKNEYGSESDYFDDQHFNGWRSRANVDIEQNKKVLDNYIGFIGQYKFRKYLHETPAFCTGLNGTNSYYKMNKNTVETPDG